MNYTNSENENEFLNTVKIKGKSLKKDDDNYLKLEIAIVT